VIPRGLGTDEHRHVDLNVRVTVDSSQSHPMHLFVVRSTEGGSTGAAE
jgi:hypothetical protein